MNSRARSMYIHKWKLARPFSTTANPASSGMSPTMRKVGAALFIGMSGVTGYLGYWQMQRYEWKVNLISRREEQLQQTPVDLPNVVVAANAPETWEHRQVRCTGTLDYTNEILCGPRAAPKGVLPRTAMSPMGYFVVTPMTLSSSHDKVLVNRGWISKEDVETGNTYQGTPGETTIVAVISTSEVGNRFTPRESRTPTDSPSSNTLNSAEYPKKLHSFDLSAMKALAGIDHDTILLNSVVVEQKSSDKPIKRSLASYLQYGVEPGTHLGYSATWFGLSGAAAIITFLKFIR